jgi:solute carrier family 50 protein (sugar transporter)
MSIEKMSTRDIAMVASVTVVLLWLTSVRDVFWAESSIYKQKCSKNVITAFGYVAAVVQCILWMLYGSTRLDQMTVPFIVNSFGAVLNALFVACYFHFAVDKQRSDVYYQIITLFPLIFIALALWKITGSNNIVGYIAMVVNIFMLFGPLIAAGEVIRKRSSRGMIPSQMIMTLICSTSWFSYGLYIFNIPAMLPNVLGVLFGVVQLCLYCWARHVEQQQAIDEDSLNKSSSHHVEEELSEEFIPEIA